MSKVNSQNFGMSFLLCTKCNIFGKVETSPSIISSFIYLLIYCSKIFTRILLATHFGNCYMWSLWTANLDIVLVLSEPKYQTVFDNLVLSHFYENNLKFCMMHDAKTRNVKHLPNAFEAYSITIRELDWKIYSINWSIVINVCSMWTPNVGQQYLTQISWAKKLTILNEI